MALRDTTKLLTHIPVVGGGVQADLDYMLRTREYTSVRPISAQGGGSGSIRVPLVRARQAGKIKSARFVSQDGVAAAANSWSFQLRKHDGAGGGAVNLSTLFDGTASAITANVTVTLGGINDADTVAAGDIVEMNVIENGAAADLQAVMMQVEIEYD